MRALTCPNAVTIPVAWAIRLASATSSLSDPDTRKPM
jgi:hypothetical protein